MRFQYSIRSRRESASAETEAAAETETEEATKTDEETDPAFTEGALRNLIFNARFNGMEEYKVISRVGAKILINEDNFATWVESGAANKRN